jgi:prefoldin subunit 1
MELGNFDSALESIHAGLGVDANSADLNRQLRVVKAKKAANAKAARKGAAGEAKKGSMMDGATFKEMQQLNEKAQLTQRELAETQSRLQTCMRDGRKAQLMRRELDGLSEGTRLFRSIGKVFLLNSKKDVSEYLDSESEGRDKLQSQLQSKLSVLEKRLANQKSEMDEVLKQ